MKKFILILSFVFYGSVGFAQMYNEELTLTTSSISMWGEKPIAMNSAGETVTLGSDFPFWTLTKIAPSGAFLGGRQLSNYWNGPYDFYQLDPQVIITISEDYFFVAGTYKGTPPPGYAALPTLNGDPLVTPFYAIFDNNLNLLKLKVHYGNPYINLQPGNTEPALTLSGAARFVDNGKEFFVLSALTQAQGFPTRIALIKLDDQLNVLLEKGISFPDGTVPAIVGGRLDYHPVNNVFTQTGLIQVEPSWGISQNFLASPFLFKFDRNLNLLSPVNMIHVGNDLEDQTGQPFANSLPYTTNVVESENGQELVWGFPIHNSGNNPFVCGYSGYTNNEIRSAFVLKQHFSSLVIMANLELNHDCGLELGPVSITRNQASLNYDLGVSDIVANGNFTGTPQFEVHPGIISLGNDLSYQSMRGFNTGSGTVSYLQSMIPGNTNDPGNVLYVNNIYGNGYSGAINTNTSNYSFCSPSLSLNESILSPEIYHFEPSVKAIATKSYDFTVKQDPFVITINQCTQVQPRLSGNTQDATVFQLFPNPSTGKLSIISDGLMDHIIQVETVLGSVLFTHEIQGAQEATFDIGHLPKGLYLVKIMSDHEVKKVERFILQ